VRRTSAALFIVLVISIVPRLDAVIYDWNGGAAGDWDNSGNWLVGGFPTANYPGQTANDTANIPGGPIVTITAGAAAINVDNLNLVGTVTNLSTNALNIAVAADIDGTIDGGANGVSFAAITLSGNSNITATGGITITGSVDGNFDLDIDANAGALTIAGSSFGPTMNNLTLRQITVGAPQLPNINIDNDLTVNFTGDPSVRNEAGVTIDVAGRVSITSVNLIGLNDAVPGTMRFGEFEFNAADVTLNEDDATTLVDGSIASTDLTISSGIGTAGAITQTGGPGITVGNNASFTVQGGQDIILNDTNNTFTGNVTFAASAGTIDDINIADDDGAFNVQAGLTIQDDLTVNSGGNITFLGGFTTSDGPVNLTASGTITATAGALSVVNNAINLSAGAVSNIDLTNPGNDFNTIAIVQSGDAHIVDVDDLILGNCNPGTQFLHLDCGGAVTQTAATSIIVGGLALEGTGPYELMEAGNQIDTLAFNVPANQVDVRDGDADALVLNNVDGVAGAIAANVVLQNDANTVTQFNAVSATGLLLRGAGNFTLTNAGNDVTTFASDSTGNQSYTDATGLVIGSVTPQTGAAVNGIDSSLGGGNVTLTALAGGAVVDQDVDTGAGNLTITTTGGDITQGVGDTITSAGTSTFTAGAGGNLITLNTNVNNFGTLEATGSTVRIQEFDAVVLNDITATTFDLDADGAVTQNGGTSIQTANVRFLGNGNFTLTQANDADTIAANIGDFLTFTDSDDLIVGSVLGTDGITTTGDIVTLIAGAGGVTVSQAVSTGGAVAGNIDFTTTGTIALNAALTAGTGDILLNSGTGVSQTVELSGAGLLLEGTGPFSLTDVDNDVNTIAADSVSGLIDFVDADGFAVGTVTDGINGVITTTAAVDTVDLEAVAGNITIGQVLTTNEFRYHRHCPGKHGDQRTGHSRFG
jgi:hypothetical protein